MVESMAEPRDDQRADSREPQLVGQSAARWDEPKVDWRGSDWVSSLVAHWVPRKAGSWAAQ